MKLDKFTSTSNIALDMVFTLLTCGIYGFFWQARLFRTVNKLIGQERYNFWPWFFLTLVTCNLYNVYIQYVMARSLCDGLATEGHKTDPNLPMIALLLGLILLPVVVHAIEQNEINTFCEQNPA